VSLMNFYIAVPFFVSAYLLIYQFAVILLLTGTLFKSKLKTESYNLLYVFNTMVAWSYLFCFIAYCIELFVLWYGQNPYEWYAFKGNTAYFRWIMIINFSSSVLGLLMFFRKLRINRWFTLLFFLSSCAFIYERIVIFITSLYRDYLPSSWSTYYDPVKTLCLYLLIILLFVLIYLRANKKRRLPFPSVFLK
jgi:hypothetical protein